MTGHARTPAIRVRCPECGVRTVDVDDVGFTHDTGVVTGWYWQCSSCDQLHSAAAEPGLLGLLHAIGVHDLIAQPGESASVAIDHRAIVSLRILLDDPALLSTLASTAPEHGTPITPTPPA